MRWKALGLEFSAIATLSDDELEQKLYGPRLTSTAPRPMPDMLWLHRELKRPAVTLEALRDDTACLKARTTRSMRPLVQGCEGR